MPGLLITIELRARRQETCRAVFLVSFVLLGQVPIPTPEMPKTVQKTKKQKKQGAVTQKTPNRFKIKTTKKQPTANLKIKIWGGVHEQTQSPDTTGPPETNQNHQNQPKTAKNNQHSIRKVRFWWISEDPNQILIIS